MCKTGIEKELLIVESGSTKYWPKEGEQKYMQDIQFFLRFTIMHDVMHFLYVSQIKSYSSEKMCKGLISVNAYAINCVWPIFLST